MERKSNRTAFVSALAIGIGLTAMQANAQQGTFNLPVQAHWGTAVLQPGKHTVQVPLPLGQTIVYLGSGLTHQLTVPLTIENNIASTRSYLRLTKVNGEYYVDEYVCGPSNKKFFFPKPKEPRHGAKDEEATLVTVTGS
ncbi:MAG TPA: hypothetical protein VHZ55_15205 [Bryobacteraceae bacterium]|nr:hypothetical protein [Bryobacteraceae bacterium]